MASVHEGVAIGVRKGRKGLVEADRAAAHSEVRKEVRLLITLANGLSGIVILSVLSGLRRQAYLNPIAAHVCCAQVAVAREDVDAVRRTHKPLQLQQ